MYPIISVPKGARETTEQLGTKLKFWFWDEEGQHLLFKQGRPGTGENWAEKVCCELSELIGLPHAKYDLSTWHAQEGVATLNMVPAGGRLVLGNEFLKPQTQQRYKAKHHLVRKVMALLQTKSIKIDESASGLPLNSAADVFVGYLLLDALVGNTDRHGENWGLILSSHEGASTISLAPTFDHASSLGRELKEEVREKRLVTNDSGYNVESYAVKSRSALYVSDKDAKPLSTLEAFNKSAENAGNGANFWLQRLSEIDNRSIQKILDNVPETIMSQASKDFSVRLIMFNKSRLLSR